MWIRRGRRRMALALSVALAVTGLAGAAAAYVLAAPDARAAVAGPLGLYYSTAPNRSGLVPLDQATVRGKVYVSVDGGTGAGIASVTFWQDNPLGPAVRTERSHPYDLAGTAADGSAQPFDTASLAEGEHVVHAQIDRTEGKRVNVYARFTVANTAPDPSPPASPTASPTASPAPSASPTAPPNPPSGWPDASNTGVKAGVTLRPSGRMTIRQDGTVIENLELTGDIDIYANNVTVRNVRLTNGGQQWWGILQREGYSGLVVEDSELFGNGRQQMQFGILNYGGMMTARRVEVHTISNGILSSVGVVEDSYLHDPKYYPGDHTDMIMCTSGPPAGQRYVIRHNTVINTLDQTGAIALFPDFGAVHDVLVENNLLAGGGYSLYGGAPAPGRPYDSSNIVVRDNVFSRRVWPKGGHWGPVAYFQTSGRGNTWANNRWEGTGQPVNP